MVLLLSSLLCFFFSGFESVVVFCEEIMLVVMRIFLGLIIEGLIRIFWIVVVVGVVNRREFLYLDMNYLGINVDNIENVILDKF